MSNYKNDIKPEIQRFKYITSRESSKTSAHFDLNSIFSSLAGSYVSSQKRSVWSKSPSATSTRNDAATHRSASVGDHKDKAPRAGSYHSRKSASSLKEYDEVDNEPSPGEPKALSKGSADGSLHGRPSRSNTSTLDRHSLKSNLSIYNPDRGGKGTSAPAPSDHGPAERAQTSYGRCDDNNPPYFYENKTRQSNTSNMLY
ncbi:uncharacterized protein Bfra_001369 [Botrytis fragariae]|uniref:Uncharacterized protein n=1 Tax=Botrytis fragariae TaxID=1964551 RepID=A0A8H6B0Q4_9HELO|nr:uncharacterized protein Bfra_001369 [Botrytis fragariae]KAF5877010.1 hypothetical protein Bfra_001369 [Botrytis fragariae]